jgi:indole-3-glycerol phosphate synthase
MSGGALASIVEYKKAEVAAARSVTSFAALARRAKAVSVPRGFEAALLCAHGPGQLALIAEIKKASPSKGLIRADFDPRALAKAYESGGAACLSVLTDGPSFMGADEDLAAARGACALPCLRKDFLVDPWQVTQSRALGADAILVILAIVDDSLAAELGAEAARLGMDVLYEVHDEREIDRASALGATMIGINNRDLRTFTIDLGVAERLAPRAPAGATLVAESGIFTTVDARRMAAAGAQAMLVGESLMRQGDVEIAVKRLLET